MSAPATDLTPILDRAARAVGRIDRDGPRGATCISVDDIEAMALALIALGLEPIAPDAPDDTPISITLKEASNASE